ncbi:hypothetical protein [Pseudoduganella albidiflava]|uniref:Uncharacterized protein n=1 Tax=Pseudoduganella albidiflava TaxID=321983 RepID=A0A411X2M6_9BURK|nr:hypothetical protein [Pseudoduganella albidiflava]QBI03276.1 hypothetical protein EYF70_22445 [Pseudoduganella albidiflava]GGY68163.1 hypothetical protein GCM10007387_57940 [Pseudoduganella albidiflava]
MSEKIIEVTQALSDGTFLSNWQFWLMLAAVNIVVTTAATCITSFYSEKGKFKAIESNFSKVITQLERTTQATKSIELSLSHQDWIEREFKLIRRIKLEEVMNGCLATRDWLGKAMIYRSDETPDADQTPLTKVLTTIELYFPEMANQADNLLQIHHKFLHKILGLQINLHNKEKELIKKRGELQALSNAPAVLRRIAIEPLKEEITSLEQDFNELKSSYSNSLHADYAKFLESLSAVKTEIRTIMRKTISS